MMTTTQNKLAIDGGPAVMTSVPSKPKRWGAAELAQLQEMLEQDSLFYWNGPQTRLLTERFQEYYPLRHVMPCSSGTAALHIAVAAAGVGPGDEVITTPVTDMGTVIGVLYQQGVPVFADLDPRSFNLDPDSVRASITEKTKAVIAVHLTGNPCALQEIKAICDEHDLVLIEDCAQAWGARYRGAAVGTIGHIGCWSLNDFKHIGCGDGGIVASNDERFGPVLQKFGDKAYDRSGGLPLPDTLAPNYRISEPQAAVAAAQMLRMQEVADARGAVGRALNRCLEGIPNIHPHYAHPEDHWTCWFYLLRLDLEKLSCDAATFGQALAAEGVAARSPYLASPIYRYPAFANHHFFNGRWPIREAGLTTMDYRAVQCPNAESMLHSTVQIPVHEGMNEDWCSAAAQAIEKVAAHYSA